MAAASNAVDEEKIFAKNCLKAEKIRIALQLEQPQKHSKLFPRAIKLMVCDILQQIVEV